MQTGLQVQKRGGDRPKHIWGQTRAGSKTTSKGSMLGRKQQSRVTLFENTRSLSNLSNGCRHACSSVAMSFTVTGYGTVTAFLRRTCNTAWPQAISNGEGDVILGADVQNLVPVGVCKVLLVLQQTQLQPTHPHTHTVTHSITHSGLCLTCHVLAPHTSK